MKLCNLKLAAYRCLFYILQLLHLYKPRVTSSKSNSGMGNGNAGGGAAAPGTATGAVTPLSPSAAFLNVPRVEYHLVGSTPIGNRDCTVSDFLSSNGDLELSQLDTPTTYIRENLVNSTPLNHGLNKSTRQRK